MGSGEIGDATAASRQSNDNRALNSSVMATDTLLDPFYSCGWDPVVSVIQNGSFLGSSSSTVPQNDERCNPHFPVVIENQTIGATSHGVHLTDVIPMLESFRSECFSEMNASFPHRDDYRLSYNQIIPHNRGGLAYITESHENCQNLVDGAISKRKRKTADAEQQGDSAMDIFDSHKENDEKNFDPNSSGKQAVKQAKKYNMVDAENSKENYVHMRAKRGQATNSHSLAERVRREKISERMKLLQELVPGCNKITGKAVMLDEIINYVQSLQQQVEFLSMKLATVNPELNVDVERILSKEILHSQGNNASTLGIGPGLSLPHSLQGLQEETVDGFPGTYQQLHHLSPNFWNSELQNILRMGSP